MVADEEDKDSKKGGPPLIDVSDITLWITKLTLYLRAKNRNHLGLKPHGIVRPAANASVYVRTEYQKVVSEWETRNDTCISKIHEAVEGNAEALEIFQQYLNEKEALAADHADKAELSQEILDKLRLRFSGELQDELAEESAKFTNFKLDASKPVTTGIDRLNGITLKLGQHNLAPSPEAKLAKLIEALNIPELETLWMNISMMPEPTWVLVVGACKKFDKAKEKLRAKQLEVNYTEDAAKKAVCSYCGKKGHTQDKCFTKQRKQKEQQLKTAGKRQAKTTGGRQLPGNPNFRGCNNCKSLDHLAKDCPRDNRKPEKSHREHVKKKETPWKDRQVSKDFRDYLKKGEKRSLEESDPESDSEDDYREWKRRRASRIDRGYETHMIGDFEEVLASEEDEVIFLDSCASGQLVIVKDQSVLETFNYETNTIGLTRAGASLTSQGTGNYRDWKNIRVCNESVKNIASAGALRKMGYGLMLMRIPRIVRLSDEEMILVATYSENGMPYVSLTELLNLPDLTVEENSEEVHLSDRTDADPLELLHKRCGHFSKSKLLEAFRNMLFVGSGLNRRHLSKKARRYWKRHLCKSCAKAKITRASFAEKDEDELTATKFLEKVTVDISVYLNCPSRQGYKYVLLFTDIATKMIWEYPLKERSGDEVLRCVKDFVEVQLAKFPGHHRLAHYHADGGKELIDQRVKTYLLEKFGTHITWSSTDTPEQNAVSERKFRTLGEMTLAMLADSGLPKSY